MKTIPNMKNLTIDIKDFAKFIVLYLAKNGLSVTPLKLQKVLYYIQAWHLVNFNKHPLFVDEPQAWVNGPVYRQVYDMFKSIPLYKNIRRGTGIDQNGDHYIEAKKVIKLNVEQWEYIDAAVKHFGMMSEEKLVFMTHSEDPWNIARTGLSAFEYSERVISHDSMYNYYKKRLDLTNKSNG